MFNQSLTMPAPKIIIWDNDGTIMGSKNPDDTSKAAKTILPGVAYLMNQENTINIICSGSRTKLSEHHSFDPDMMIGHFTKLMEELPIIAAVFSPAKGGTECWVMVKDSCCGGIEVRRADEDPRYKEYIGQFQKPDTGMFVVIQDLLNEFDLPMTAENTVMIGDTWQDQEAARLVDIPFMPAQYIHGAMAESEARLYMRGQKELPRGED